MIPLCSSNQMMRALKRMGVERGPLKRGTHQTVIRTVPDGRILIAIAIIGKKEVPKGTLSAMLKELEISMEHFQSALR